MLKKALLLTLLLFSMSEIRAKERSLYISSNIPIIIPLVLGASGNQSFYYDPVHLGIEMEKDFFNDYNQFGISHVLAFSETGLINEYTVEFNLTHTYKFNLHFFKHFDPFIFSGIGFYKKRVTHSSPNFSHTSAMFTCLPGIKFSINNRLFSKFKAGINHYLNSNESIQKDGKFFKSGLSGTIFKFDILIGLSF